GYLAVDHFRVKADGRFFSSFPGHEGVAGLSFNDPSFRIGILSPEIFPSVFVRRIDVTLFIQVAEVPDLVIPYLAIRSPDLEVIHEVNVVLPESFFRRHPAHRYSREEAEPPAGVELPGTVVAGVHFEEVFVTVCVSGAAYPSEITGRYL